MNSSDLGSDVQALCYECVFTTLDKFKQNKTAYKMPKKKTFNKKGKEICCHLTDTNPHIGY